MPLSLFITDINGVFEIPTPRLLNLTKISDSPVYFDHSPPPRRLLGT